ncbi:MAG: AAA family ATPase [Candidatus Diapherotrites archaeon]|nr:AAA family ATPase [Candidatus Diapherotrites archaeon]
MIVGLTGLARTGKDTFAQYLVEKHKFRHFDFNKNVITPEMLSRKLEPTKMNASYTANSLREKFGLGILAKRIVELIKENHLEKSKVIVTGFRDIKEVALVKKEFPEFKLVLLKADSEKRFERKSSEDARDRKKFFERDKFDTEKAGMDKVFELADFEIENDSTFEELCKKIDEVLKKLHAI